MKIQNAGITFLGKVIPLPIRPTSYYMGDDVKWRGAPRGAEVTETQTLPEPDSNAMRGNILGVKTRNVFLSIQTI